ncbi:1-acyl-sn-glycerol-3-phosphate acyltransferase [Candidatus Pelagibacter sp.]|nr:1-acyl-sn-glycerol-3-phosphate acyltransferase [Candidatus Pelagibacter sp.]
MPSNAVLFGGKLMGYWTSVCLKTIMNTEIEVLGKKNIIKDNKFFIAASHQSMFETFYLQTMFNSPVFILKKELLIIPIFGWYLKKIGSISIQRNKISRDNLGFFKDIHNIIRESNRPLIIFPQGTRVSPDDRSPFKKGAARIYEELKISCQPIAINSGYVWPKTGRKKASKKIIVSILSPINYGLEKNVFLKSLEEKIYSELDRIN